MLEEIPLSRPDVSEADIEMVVRVLRSGRLSIGPVQETFERACARVAGRAHGVACSSGTAGLHMALLACGVGAGDEVIVPTFGFIATANSVVMTGATPVFVDCCPTSLNMDPEKVRSAIGEKTKAIIGVETFGNTTHMEAYRKIADAHEIKLIEDCCEGIGGSSGRMPVGSFGHVGVFGFYPNKQVTTGEGGMVVTDDDRLAEVCRSLRNQGRAGGRSSGTGGSGGVGGSGSRSVRENVSSRERSRPNVGGSGGGGGDGNGDGGGANGPAGREPGDPAGGSPSRGAGGWMRFVRLGFNYRMPEINAALGLSQVRRLTEILERRNEVAQRYVERFMANSDVIVPTVDGADGAVMSWFVFVIRLSDQYTGEERDRIIEGMHRHEVGAAVYFPCIHLQPFYRDLLGTGEGMFPIAERIAQRTIALPFYTRLSPRDQDYAAATFELMLSRENIRRT